MKKFLLLIIATTTIIGSAYAQKKEIMTNEIVISLVEMEFSSDIINAKILSSEAQFDTSIDALMHLKENNVHSDVIKTMINYQSTTDNKKLEKTGIYYFEGDEEKQILPTVFASSKTNILASALTYGIASSKIKSILNNAEASTVVSDTIKFVFHFTPLENEQLIATDWWFRVTVSPAEFVLVKLKSNERKGNREVEVGEINLWVGNKNGVQSKNAIKCDIVKLNDGEFSVKPSTKLEKGEYCFFYAGTIPLGGYTNQSVFDFSVQ